MFPLKILTQPDDITCGPTSLHAVYNYFKDKISLEDVIKQISYLEDGGTLAVNLGIHALKRGYNTELYTYNLDVFDPSWFNGKDQNIVDKLSKQLDYKKGKRFREATMAYINYLELGGALTYRNLTVNLLKSYFERKLPVLAGLSATYLYQYKREYTNSKNQSVYDDIKGEPMGHFVVLSGYDDEKRNIVVADPYKTNPISGDNYYSVKVTRLINSILLGIVTYDANLLIIQPKDK